MTHILHSRIGLMARCLVMMTVACTTSMRSPAKANDDESARNRFRLLDSRTVEKSENAQLAVGAVRKHKSNPLFVEDKPWEKRFDNLYGNVIFDTEDKIYKCWYSPFIVDRSAKGMTLEQRKEKYSSGPGREMGICFATSEDGIKWTKPELGLVEYEGSKKNNILWRGPHGAGIFKLEAFKRDANVEPSDMNITFADEKDAVKPRTYHDGLDLKPEGVLAWLATSKPTLN